MDLRAFPKWGARLQFVNERPEELEAAIAAIEEQRAVLGGAVTNMAVAPLRERLAALLAQSIAETQQLKQVSVLFADVVGSTTLSQQLDPEDIHAVMDGALERFSSIVRAHRGAVLQYAGDSMLAVFGAQEAHEDDAERAVRAGLAIVQEARAQEAQVQARHGFEGFDVRVGINTGAVLLGGGVDAEGAIRGISVNIAARMEQTAPAGGLRISHDTYRHVRGVFDVEEQPPIQVKGISEPVRSYLVQRAKPRAFRVASRGVDGVETRMVGRERELVELQQALKALYDPTPELHAITIVAEAGLGKSCLLYEFENWAAARPEAFCLFQGRAQPLSQNQPYGLLRDIFVSRFEIADSDSVEVARQKITDGIAPLFLSDDGHDMAEAHAHLLGHLIGIDFSESRHVKVMLEDGKQIRTRGFHAAAQMFRRLSRQTGTPIVVLLDDLHWADDGSLDFIEQLVHINRDVPMLVLGSTRPSLYERRPGWADGQGRHQLINLVPLSRENSRNLVDGLLQKMQEIPAALRELVTGGAEGNPFYMEELVKMLIDVGAIATGTVDDAQDWRVIPDKLLAAHVPSTLTGVLQARLDSLGPSEKSALQQASVVGHVFWDEALATLDPNAIGALATLPRRELITPHAASAFEGLREYAFRHHTLHQVTYDTVLKRIKREAHGKVAQWLADRPGKTHLDLIAEHYERAGDNAKACEYFTLAAESASALYANEAMLSHASRGLALASQDDHVTRWRLLSARSKYLAAHGDRAALDADLDALQALADALDDGARQAEVAMLRARALSVTGDYRGGEVQARHAIEMAESIGALSVASVAHYFRAAALAHLGDHTTARTLADVGCAAARAVGDRAGEIRMLNILGLIAAAQGDSIATLTITQEILHLCRELGDRSYESSALSNLGGCFLQLGDYSNARRYLDESLQLARTIGQRYVESNVLLNRAMLARREGDAAGAAWFARAAIEIAASGGVRQVEGPAQCCLADAELGLGRHEAAREACTRALEIFQQMSTPQLVMMAVAGLAQVALEQGDLNEALRHAEAVLTHLAGGGTLDGIEEPLRIRLVCHQVLARACDPRAVEVLAAAHADLISQAERISDTALRRSFLNQVPHHREIIAASVRAQIPPKGTLRGNQMPRHDHP